MRTTDVLVVGAGPCGMTLANLLGTYGVDAVVIDRELDIIDYPRAVGIDDESLRTCQTVDLVHDVLADTLQGMPIRYYTSWGRLLAHVEPSARPFGWARRNLFLQPLLEKTLRAGANRFASLDVRLATELIALDQTERGVLATVRDAGGTTEIHARYAVGADGGRSSVRDLVDVELVGTTEPVKWLVVDVVDDQLDAPYSAVYCDADSPTLMVPLPYRHRRFEFRLREGDDEQAVVEHDYVRGLLAERYGSTPLPTIVRARVYLHHSRVASTFQVGDVFLAGDAAHLQPPFFGQGMNSGIRDATNLAWKLAAVARGQAGDALLATYDTERRPHASEMVTFATRIGAMYRPRNIVTERVRDVVFRGIQRVPGGRDYVLQMKYKPMPRYTDGFVTDVAPKRKDYSVGRMFPQPHVEVAGERILLDETLGDWFVVLCLGVGRDELDADSLAWWESIGARVVTPDDVGDIDGVLAAWRTEHGAELVVLRPDRYVAACCKRGSFPSVTERLRARLGAGPVPGPSVERI